MPKSLGPLLGSGILLTSIVAVLLNLYFNKLKRFEEASLDNAEATQASEA
jgi:xanthine/uracil permease